MDRVLLWWHCVVCVYTWELACGLLESTGLDPQKPGTITILLDLAYGKPFFYLHSQLWRVNSFFLVPFKQTLIKYLSEGLQGKLQGKSAYVNLLFFGQWLTSVQCSKECICKIVIAQIIQKTCPWHATAFPEEWSLCALVLSNIRKGYLGH